MWLKHELNQSASDPAAGLGQGRGKKHEIYVGAFRLPPSPASATANNVTLNANNFSQLPCKS